MRFFHLSDLHIGKQLHYYSLKENQRHILHQITERAAEYQPDALLICGDIFDKSIPSGEAYTIFDEFLNELTETVPNMPILIIGGNHDNPQRLSYASHFLEKHKIHVSALPPDGKEEYLKKITLTDQWGPVDFYLMPFLKPGYVRHLFEEGVITDYNSAVRELLNREQIDKDRRNVILSHQFYTNGGEKPVTCDSEQAVIQVGGLDNVDVSVLDGFEYAALGHIHGAQKIKHPHIRYCGTPLKYSVSEENQKKSITLVTMEEKGAPLSIETIPLIPLQDVRRERGTLTEILGRAPKGNCRDFISVTLTDEEEPYHPMEQLEEVYDYLLELRMDNERTRNAVGAEEEEELESSPLKVFRAFYEEMRSKPMSSEEETLLTHLLEHMEEPL